MSACTRWSLACVAAALALTTNRPASSQSPPPAGIELRWIAPPECPDAARFRAEMERLLGRSVSAPAASFLAIATVERERDDRWHLRLETRAGGDVRTRELDDASCQDVADATAVIVALAIDEEQSSRRGVRTPAAPAPDRRTPSDPPRDDGQAPERWRWAVRARGALDVASLPEATAGVGAALAVARGAVRVEVAGSFWLPRTATVPDRPDMGGTISLVTAELRGCLVPLHRLELQIGACLGLDVGRIAAEGFGVNQPGANAGLWLAPGLGLLAVWRTGGAFALVLDVDALAPLTRDRFALVGIGDVYRAPALTARAALGLELRFP